MSISILNIKNLILASIVIAIALSLSACKKNQLSFLDGEEEITDEEVIEDDTDSGIITATDDGFEPSTVTVNVGDSILWINDSSTTIQIGSANHPTHTINQEITGDEFVIELKPGETSTVTVTKVGSWGYHDHLRPSMTGKIVVVELTTEEL